jgi:DNA (cytosine-5)-methyltransferase 1
MAKDHRVLDLFSGMGGFSLGFSRLLGRNAVTGVDSWDRAVAAYSANVGEAVRGDLRDWSVSRGDYDVVIGGPPCRPWSSVNLRRRRGLHEDHDLVQRFFMLVQTIRPRAFVMENVPPLARDPSLRVALRALRHEYSLHEMTVVYSDWGAATSRRRLFVLGFLEDGAALQRALMFLDRMRAPAMSVRDVIRDLEDAPRGSIPDHVWSEPRTVDRYRDKYAEGRYGWRILEWDMPAPSFGNVTKTYTLHPSRRRVISVREAMRIMGFPDDYMFPDTGIRDRYQMVADAVSPVFSGKLAEAVVDALDG